MATQLKQRPLPNFGIGALATFHNVDERCDQDQRERHHHPVLHRDADERDLFHEPVVHEADRRGPT